MNFQDAVKAMLQGKKVRRGKWAEMTRCSERWIELKNERFYNHKNTDCTISYQEYFAQDWEIIPWKKTKTLGDKGGYWGSDNIPETTKGFVYKGADVRKAMKELILKVGDIPLNPALHSQHAMDNYAKEIIGEELL